jgi:hypothetical protein
MSCCNFGSLGLGPGRGLSPGRGLGHGRGLRPDREYDGRRGCCNVNWGSCTGNRRCPGRGPLVMPLSCILTIRKPFTLTLYNVKIVLCEKH